MFLILSSQLDSTLKMQQFLATLTAKKVVNLLKNRASYAWSCVTKKAKMCGMPVSLSIEPAAVCQLHCPECILGSGNLQRKNHYLDFELYKRIIDENEKTLAYLMLYFQGEPFLAPKIFDMLKYATNKKIYCATSTNAQVIYKSVAEKIVESGLQKLIISLDGTTQKSYEMYRKGGELKKVLDAIQNINDEKAKKSVSRPEIELQFIVFRHNENEIDDFARLAKQLHVNKYTIKTAQIYDFENKSELIPKNKRWSRYIFKNGQWQLKRKLKNRCLRQWQGAVVTVDGELLPCCFDKNANYSFGSLLNNSCSQLWHSATATCFHQQVLDNRKQIEICRNCSE